MECEKKHCEYIEYDKSGLCKYYKGNIQNIERCYSKCEIEEIKKLMQGTDRQPLRRRRGALTQKR